MTTRLNIGRPELLKYRVRGDYRTRLRSGDHGYARCCDVLWFGGRLWAVLDNFSL
jgi:hypothetical protein